MGVKYSHLCLEERRCIYTWRHLKQNVTIREIARRLGRSHSTISREISRNSGCWCDMYYHNPAHHFAKIRLRNRAKRPLLKNEKTKSYVIGKVKLGWSPQIISGRLKIEPDKEDICHESIYQFIYKQASALRDYLPRKHKKRRKKYPYRKHVKKIDFKTSILERHLDINDRIQPGHWESDSIISKGSRCALNVLLERTTRLAHITKLSAKTALATKNAIVKKLSKHPADFVHSITYDNGTENAAHLKTNNELNCKSYFCQAYHSWEKGSVEQLNGLIRRYLPKKEDFKNVTSQRLKKIEFLLNSRPRKCLGYKTPLEVYTEIYGALPT